MLLATGEVRKLPCSCPYPLNPSLSPDGAEFVYQPTPRPTSIRANELRIARTDGSDDRLLYSAPDEVAYVYPYGFSPDGRQHLIGRRYTDGRSDLVVLSLKGGSVRTLKTAGHAAYRRGVAFSPDGKFIAYNALPATNTTNQDIHIVSIDTGQVTILVDDPADKGVLGWAPDGTGILMRSDRSGTHDAYFQPMRGAQPIGPLRLVKRNIGRIGAVSLGFTGDGRFFYRMQGEAGGAFLGRLDESGNVGSKLEEIAGGHAIHVGWSADGSKLAYTFHPERGPLSIGIQAPLRGAVSTLTAPIFPYSMDWLRDGWSLVLVGRDDVRRLGIVLLDTRTGQKTVLKEINDKDMRYDNAAVSPDGKHLYYREARQEPLEKGRIVRLDLASREERIVLEPAGPFSLSPDGRSIAIVDSRTLKVVALGDRSSYEIAQDANGPVAWSADGGSVLFERNRQELWRVPSEGGSAVRVAVFERPFYGLRVHPDGRQIAPYFSRQTAEVWVAENILSAAVAGVR